MHEEIETWLHYCCCVVSHCMLDTISDLVDKVENRARKPWITQEMISKKEMEEFQQRRRQEELQETEE